MVYVKKGVRTIDLKEPIGIQLKNDLYARAGDILVLSPDGTLVPLRTVGGERRHEAPRPPSNGAAPIEGPGEMPRQLVNFLYARTKLSHIRERCTALYSIIGQNPGLRATEYTRLLRDAGIKLKDGVDGRQEVQRALEKLFEIEAVQRGGLAKQPSYTLTRQP